MRISPILPIVVCAMSCAGSTGDRTRTRASDVDAASTARQSSETDGGAVDGSASAASGSVATDVTPPKPDAADAGGTPPTDQHPPQQIPIGRYMQCAQGLLNADNNQFLNISGFQAGRVLTLTQREQTVTAKYVDPDGRTQSLRFTQTTQDTATLAQPGDELSGFSSVCVTGLGQQTGYPATMSASSGSLIYSAGMVFVALKGRLQSDSGSCGMVTQPDASFWSICRDRESDLQPPAAGRPSITEAPVGDYACTLELDTHRTLDGKNYYVATGSSGRLQVTQDGLNVSAQYEGDTKLSGKLSLDPSTSTIAVAKSGQALMAACGDLTGSVASSRTPEEIPVEAASLAKVDSTLFLSFAGTTSAASSCPGVRVAGSLICSK